MKSLGILSMSILACVLYGIVHDQITARLCVEYFTIFHAPIFGTDDPTLLGFGRGIGRRDGSMFSLKRTGNPVR
jgi:hypothetical protein